MANKFLIISLVFSSLFSVSSSVPSETLLVAADILSNSGYLSMSLTLQLVSNSLIPHSPALTIFSPSDSAFARSGQPSLSLLQFHFSPLSFHLRSLKPLSSGSKIPTLFDNHSLTVTSGPSDDDAISVNGVKINGSPIYDDGSLVILGIGEFLDPDFEVSPKIPGTGGKHGCSFEAGRGFYSFKEATGVLRSKAFSVIASFLDLQLVGSKDRPALTIFAPVDEVMKGFVGNVDEYSSIFLRHVVPCKMPWKDLVNFNDGMVLDTYSEGFGIRIRRSGDIFMLNEVPVSFPDMYQSDWLVVHGLRGILEGPNRPEEVGSASSEMGNNRETSILDDVEL